MPSFDAVLEPDMVAIKNSVSNAQKEIATRFDFKGTSAAVELKEKEKEIQLVGDGDFQIEQVSTVLIGKLTKQGVTVNYLDMSGKIEKIGGDKVRQTYKIKAGIEAELAKKITGGLKNSKLKVQASIQGDEVRVTGKNRDDLQLAIALLKKEFADQPLKYQNFRD
ncbi:YajQ family cyclic di-GMP-binding protein [Ideonella sp. B7]|uniref:YajQ family cyclic di-GMP-binding protein n=1 Tax=Ideonella benzenivorans TaxID=2831643 RepID=UPI001CEC4DF5|nr:YajQ family cyclic di-GMP-binding protein [Ideonella benzenivorans]MCA6217755.1 YajQ family cyclic di-GMP-binding protein [Ideonella benzenivorans]